MHRTTDRVLSVVYISHGGYDEEDYITEFGACEDHHGGGEENGDRRIFRQVETSTLNSTWRLKVHSWTSRGHNIWIGTVCMGQNAKEVGTPGNETKKLRRLQLLRGCGLHGDKYFSEL